MRAARFFSGPSLIFTGILHFVIPKTYESIMPSYLPAHRELVYASGVAEIATGLGSLHPKTRRLAGWLGLATMIGVFPANLHMALNPDQYEHVPGAPGALYARLPIQALFMFWIYKACLGPKSGTRDAD